VLGAHVVGIEDLTVFQIDNCAFMANLIDGSRNFCPSAISGLDHADLEAILVSMLPGNDLGRSRISLILHDKIEYHPRQNK